MVEGINGTRDGGKDFRPRRSSRGFHDASNADGLEVGEAMDIFYGDKSGEACDGPRGGEEGGLAWVEVRRGLLGGGWVCVGKRLEGNRREDGGLH